MELFIQSGSAFCLGGLIGVIVGAVLSAWIANDDLKCMREELARSRRIKRLPSYESRRRMQWLYSENQRSKWDR